MQSHIWRVGMPEWTAEDQAFAKAVQAMMGAASPGGLRDTVPSEVREAEQGMGGGSDDIAEVSWNVPTVRLRYPSNIPGVTGHHWSSGIAMATPIAHKGANYGARVVAMTAVDVLATPALLAEAKRFFAEVTTKEHTWASLVPEGTPPPVQINAERMARFRPHLEPLVYDPTRFGTYLEQLGVAWPTLRRP